MSKFNAKNPEEQYQLYICFLVTEIFTFGNIFNASIL